MPRTNRDPPGGFIYHILNRANRRQRLFDSDRDYHAFMRVVREAQLIASIRILQHCTMPNHWHFALWPDRDHQVACFMHHLTTTHSVRWNAARGLTGTGHVYQGAYKFFPVQEDDHYYRLCRYIVRNPLRAGLVERAEQWPWSSLSAVPDIPLHEGPLPLGSDWLNWVNQPQTDAELAAMRSCVQRGAPYGNEVWQRQVAVDLGLQHTLRTRGRPRLNA